jgi:hypothetical protein
VTAVFDQNPNDTFTIQDWVTWDYGIDDPVSGVVVQGGGFTPPGATLTQAFAGENLYLAPIPSNIPDPMMGSTALGSMEILAGKAPFYILQYAGYIVAMNTATSGTVSYQFTGCQSAVNLRTGESVDLCAPVHVPPLSTLVLYDASSL